MLTNFAFRHLRQIPALQERFRWVVRHLPSRRRLVEHQGQRLVVDPTELSGYYLYYEQIYDSEVFQFLENELPRYTRVIDVGANIGVYTVFFAARVLRVDAFEPVPEIAAKLRENLELNDLNNVKVYESCVGCQETTVRFSQPKRHNFGTGHIVTEEGQLSCPCTTLDNFLEGDLTEALLIKMDIEGAEWLAIGGATSLLKKRKAPLALLLEIHPEQIQGYGGSVEALYMILIEAGMRVQTITQGGLESFSLQAPPRFWWASIS
jgi:FkbM family methyltransferase